MLLGPPSLIHSRSLRWLLFIITVVTACMSLSSVMVSSAALRDHYSGVAPLTARGLHNMWALLPIATVNCFVNLIGITGAVFHHQFLLLTYGFASFVSLVVHITIGTLDKMHLLEFTAETVNGSRSGVFGQSPLYSDTMSDLGQLIAEPTPAPVPRELDVENERYAKLFELLNRYMNATGRHRPVPSQTEDLDSGYGGHRDVLNQGETASRHRWPNASAPRRRPYDTQALERLAAGPLPPSAIRSAEGDPDIEDSGHGPAAGVSASTPSASAAAAGENDRKRAQGRSLIRTMELAFQKQLVRIGSLQRRFKCCGASGYRDYLKQNLTVPIWCCLEPDCDRTDLLQLTLNTDPLQAARLIYTEGCGAIVHKVGRYVNGVLSVLEMAVMAMHVVGCVLAIIIGTCCQPNTVPKTKQMDEAAGASRSVDLAPVRTQTAPL